MFTQIISCTFYDYDFFVIGEMINAESLTPDNVIVTKSDFQETIKTVKPSVTMQDLMYFEKLKQESRNNINI